MADELIVVYKAKIDGYTAELEKLKKADEDTRKEVEKPITPTVDTKSLRAQLKEAQADVIKLSEKFGVTSKEAANAAKKAAELKDAIGDAKALTDAFNPDAKFNALSSSLGGVIGGFQAYEGALALIGGESEDLQKTLVKLNALMSLSQGLQQIGEARDSFRQLGAVIKNTTVFQTLYNAATRTATAVQTAFGIATNATSLGFKVLRGAIVATGIGALVVALGLVIANFDAISGWIKKSPLGSLANQVGNLVQRFTDFIGVTSEGERSLERIAKSNTRANEAIKNRIALLKAQGGSEKEIFELGQQMTQNDLNTLRKTLDVKKKLSKEESAQFRELKAKLEIDEAAYNKKLADDRKTAAQKAKDDAKKAKDEEQKLLEEKRKNAIDAEKKIVDDLIKERDGLINELDSKPIKLEIDTQIANIARMQSTNQDPKLIEQEQQKLLKLEKDFNQQKYAIVLDFNEKQKKASEKANQDAIKNNLGAKTIEEIGTIYEDAITKTTEAAKNLNQTIKGQIESYANNQIAIEIRAIVDQKVPKDYYDEIDKREKDIKNRKTNSKLEELQKERDLINIQNERDTMTKKSLEEQKKILDEFLTNQGIDPKMQVDSQNLQNQIDEVAKKINENTTIIVDAKISDESKAQIKAAIDSVFEFANSTVFIKLGLDPAAMSKLKSQIENVKNVFDNKDSSDEDRIKAIASAAGTATVAAVDMVSAREKAASEERIAQLNVEKEAELAAAEGNAEKQDIIRQKYDQKIKAEKRKQFEADKRASIIKAIINTAVAIAQVMANPFLIPIVAAIGAAQIALIASQPTPKFKDGGMVGKPISDGLLSGKPHSAGGILLEAEGGEYIINKKSTQNHLPLIEAINDGSINDMLNKHYIMPAIENAEKNALQRNEKRISDIQTLIVNKAINETLRSIERKGDINTNKIVEAVKGDKFTL